MYIHTSFMQQKKKITKELCLLQLSEGNFCYQHTQFSQEEPILYELSKESENLLCFHSSLRILRG
jgi:hypothetical protein